MSGPTDKLQQQISDTIAAYVEECGLQLLEQPLRLEGLLRDIYPEHRAAVSVTMECLQTGCHIDVASIQEAAARLALRSGLTPQWSEFGVRLWRRSLKGRNLTILQASFDQDTDSKQTMRSARRVEDILGQFRG